MATAEQIAGCKAYGHLDDEDDKLIGVLCDAAAGYLAKAGATRGMEEGSQRAAQYDLALWALTTYYYDHRDAVGTEAPLPIGARPIIHQLKLTQ